MMNLTYYSILIEWEFEHREAGEYGWSGWAKDAEDAERKARVAMKAAEPDLNEGLDPDDVGGDILEVVEGAQIWAAPEVAQSLEVLIGRGNGATQGELREMICLLRPCSEDDGA